MIYMKKREAHNRVFTGSFYFKIAIAGMLWYVWFLNAKMVSEIENL